jgi:L-2-hydroxyglutarate oxidase
VTDRYDVAIIGGGIVGLATAVAIGVHHQGARIVVIEKEHELAHHQTGNNSGVLHSGIYYPPGSLKAKMCRSGNEALVWFCKEHGIRVEVCGKLIVATDPEELPRLAALEERARAHRITVERLGPDGLRDHERHVAGIAGLYVPSTGITDFRGIVDAYAGIVRRSGGVILMDTKVTGFAAAQGTRVVETTAGAIEATWVVNCGGLHSDRLARLGGTDPEAQIVPFRGEYYELTPESRSLVNALIYPVPDPQFPFLGVHFTKMIDGSVHAGPNAVLALSREGYRKRDVSPGDTWEVLRYRGFRRLARRHARAGAAEVARSLSKRLFTRSLQRLVPEVTRDDLVPAHAGVRAQALTDQGSLVDDFLIVEGDHTVHVCNAPSPAATSSLPIGEAIAARIVL